MNGESSSASRGVPDSPLCPPDPVAMRDAEAFVHTVLLFAAGWAAWSGWRWWRRRAPPPRRRAPPARVS